MRLTRRHIIIPLTPQIPWCPHALSLWPVPKGSPDSPFKRGLCPRRSTAQPASRPAIARTPRGSILFFAVAAISHHMAMCASMGGGMTLAHRRAQVPRFIPSVGEGGRGLRAWVGSGPCKRGGIVIFHIRGAQSAGGKARELGGLRR